MVTLKCFETREQWAANRSNGIGGSEISAVLGLNPWLSNVELWEIKTGRAEHKDISDNPVVRYGNEAESAIRTLFALDHPELRVGYTEFNSWRNDLFPWAQASLDGWLTDEAGRHGVLEVKTTEIQRSSDWEKWDGCVPNQYFAQVVYYMGVIEADFAELRAAIRYTERNGEKRTTIRDYHIEREDVADDIKLLMDKGAAFWEMVEKDIRPSRILPEI